MPSSKLKIIAGGAPSVPAEGGFPDADSGTRWLVNRMRSVISIRWDADVQFAIGVDLCDGIEPEGVQRALDLAQRTLKPATPDLIVTELTKLKNNTAGRWPSEDEWRATLRSWTSELKVYPGDVIRTACHPRRWSWWPPLADLLKECDSLCRTRRAIAAALSTPPKARGVPEPEWTPPTDNDKTYVANLLARMRGAVSDVTATAVTNPAALSDTDRHR